MIELSERNDLSAHRRFVSAKECLISRLVVAGAHRLAKHYFHGFPLRYFKSSECTGQQRAFMLQQRPARVCCTIIIKSEYKCSVISSCTLPSNIH